MDTLAHIRRSAALAAALALLIVVIALPGDSTTADTITSPPRGVAGDLWADKIIGQPGFSEAAEFETRADKLWLPHGVIVDTRDQSDEKLYVYDGGNSRILGFDLEDCYAAVVAGQPCSADLVLGQPDMSSSACNGHSNYQGYPKRAPAYHNNLCGVQENQISLNEGGSGASMAIGPTGTFYVTDYFNHRVLAFGDPFSPTEDLGADLVWGQQNFMGQTCDRGQSQPSDNTLCFDWGGENNWTAGVDIDVDGNLWVVDSANYRVLRFPAGQYNADVVLGQDDFTSSVKIGDSACYDHNDSRNRFRAPAAVRVVKEDDLPGVPQGRVYVADHGCRRILYFDPPFTQPAGYVGTVFGKDALEDPAWSKNNVCRSEDYHPDIRPYDPQGIDFDPSMPGRIWINNMGNRTLDLWDQQTEEPVVNSSGERVMLGEVCDGNILADHSGSYGIDSDGNVLVAISAGSYNNDVIKFEKNEAPNGDLSYTGPTRLFRMNERELTAADLGGDITGVAASADQLFVSEKLGSTGRLLVWDQGTADSLYDALSNGKPADGVLGATQFDSFDSEITCCRQLKVDDATPTRHLWAASWTFSPTRSVLYVYDLPVSAANHTPSVIEFPIPLLGSTTTIAVDTALWGVAPARDGSFVWVSDTINNRVIRIRDPLTSPQVDIILGQADASGTECNRGGSVADDTLCRPGALAIDNGGNLYISDHALENQGNKRLLRFDASQTPTDNTEPTFGLAAAAEFSNVATWEPAFNSAGHMVIGFNPYHTHKFPDLCEEPADPFPLFSSNFCDRFPGVFVNPLASTEGPDMLLRDFHSMAFGAAFDKDDNLYATDLNRARVLIYEEPLPVVDQDGDGCPDKNELGDNEFWGGRRDPLNPWDYFNPTNDGQNRVDDIVAVLNHYFLAEGEPGYDEKYDRSPIPETGAEPWRLGPPNGQILIDDILHAVNSYFHNCGIGMVKPTPTPTP